MLFKWRFLFLFFLTVLIIRKVKPNNDNKNIIIDNNIILRLGSTKRKEKEPPKEFVFEKIEDLEEHSSLSQTILDKEAADKWIESQTPNLFTYPTNEDGSLDIAKATKVNYIGKTVSIFDIFRNHSPLTHYSFHLGLLV